MTTTKPDFYNVLNYRAFEIKYIGPSYNLGSRVSINDLRHGTRKIINYDYRTDNINEMAYNYLSSLGIKIIGRSESKKGYLLFSDDFSTDIKQDVRK